MTLLEQAKQVKATNKPDNYDEELVDLALAYLNGEVAIKQVNGALKTKSGSSSFHKLAYALFTGVKNNRLRITKV